MLNCELKDVSVHRFDEMQAAPFCQNLSPTSERVAFYERGPGRISPRDSAGAPYQECGKTHGPDTGGFPPKGLPAWQILA